jgi:hypothetical protein
MVKIKTFKISYFDKIDHLVPLKSRIMYLSVPFQEIFELFLCNLAFLFGRMQQDNNSFIKFSS